MRSNQYRSKYFEVIVVSYPASDLLVAYSPGLKGLMVPGRSLEELDEKLPRAITEVMEANGRKVISVDVMDTDDGMPEMFLPRKRVANAVLEALPA